MPKSGTSPEPPNDQISDSERTQSPGDLQAWQDLLAPAQGTKLSPAPAPHSMETPLGWEPHPCTPGFPQGHSTCTHKGCSMPGSPAALAEAVLRAQNTLGTVQDTKLQQSTPRGRDHRMSLCSQDTARTWDHPGVPSSSPWLHSRSQPQRMFLRTLPAVTLMAIPATRVSSPATECHRPLCLSTKEKPEGNSTQHELCKGLSTVQALPCEASCSAWPPWAAGFQLQIRLQPHGAAAASLGVFLQCHQR